MKRFRILSLDGGGIRGIYSLSVLAALEKSVALHDRFDLFSGTSTGSIIALCLALGMKAEEVLKLYSEMGPYVFVKSESENQAIYQNKALFDILSQKVFSNGLKLSDLKKKVVIPSLRLKTADKLGVFPEIYSNFDNCVNKEALLTDVAASSCSAPVYFPSFKGSIDGGVFAPNPTMTAITESLKTGVSLESIQVLSIGTGKLPLCFPDEISWNAKTWCEETREEKICNFPLMTVFTESMAQNVSDESQYLLKENYLRINGLLPEIIEIDDVSKAETLFMQGLEAFSKNQKAIQEFFS